MNAKAQWMMRQMGLEVLRQFVSVTNILIIVVAIRFYKLSQYGIGVMPQYRFPKAPSVELILQTFLHSNVYPVIIWLPVAIAIDSFLRRPILK
jgi:hypothetical protein